MAKDRPNPWASLIVWLLPHSRVKTWALRRLGNSIGQDVVIGHNFVLGCGPFRLGDRAIISSFNVFRNMAAVDMGYRTFIGSYNQFTAAPAYQQFSPHVGRLIIEERAAITNRHYFDCSGQIILRKLAGIGGIKSIFQSHEIDLFADEQTVGRIVIGENAMTASAVIMLRDTYLPDKSILAAGSLLNRARDGEDPVTQSLYAGTPAKPIRQLAGFTWWDREDYLTEVTAFDDTKFLDY